MIAHIRISGPFIEQSSDPQWIQVKSRAPAAHHAPVEME
jgi:hypothetical protein